MSTEFSTIQELSDSFGPLEDNYSNFVETNRVTNIKKHTDASEFICWFDDGRFKQLAKYTKKLTLQEVYEEFNVHDRIDKVKCCFDVYDRMMAVVFFNKLRSPSSDENKKHLLNFWNHKLKNSEHVIEV